jgi:hypothetical protein
MAALGMSKADLFPSDGLTPPHIRFLGAGNGVSGDHTSEGYKAPKLALKYVIKKYGEPAACWSYFAEDGTEYAKVYRFDFIDDKGQPDKTYRPVSLLPSGLWVLKDPPGKWLPCNADKIANAPRVWVAEGEKACDALIGLGLAAATSAHGAKSPEKTDWSCLAGREVIIWPDNDPEGEDYARKVKAILSRLDPQPKVNADERK